jgi:hypothetical protein
MNRKKLPARIEPNSICFKTLFINPYGTSRYKFDAGLPASELVEQLKSETAAPFSMDAFGRRKRFSGTVKDSSFELNSLHKMSRNSWAPVAVGTITPMGNRSQVDITFKLSLAVMVFMLIWMTMAVLGSLVFLLVPGEKPFPMSLLPILFPGFGIVLVTIGAKLGQGDQRSILNYFADLPDTMILNQSRLIE